jgi:hypothetical protein
MKRLAGQAGRTLGHFFRVLGAFAVTLVLVSVLAVGGLAFRLAQGPLQIPWVATVLANSVSGADIHIQVGQAALGWAGYKKGGGAPLYLQLGQVSVRNAGGAGLATIADARMELSLAALFSRKAAVYVASSDARVAGANVPIALLAAIHLHGFGFAQADLWVTLGPGQFGPRGLAVPLAGGKFLLDVTSKAVRLSDGQFILAPAGGSAPVIHVTGSAHRDGFWQGTLTITGNAVQAPDLPHYWPPQLAPQTREWVTQNIIAGTASGPDFTFSLSAPGGLADLKLDNAVGRFNARNLTLIWLPAALPITALNGSFTLTDPDDIDIAADHGMLGGIRITAASMHIAGVAHRDQTGTVHIPVSGTIQAALDVLNKPPLGLLKAVPAPVLAATGDLTGRIDVAVPFKRKVTIGEVRLKVATVLTNVAIPLARGLFLTQGRLSVGSTMQKLDVAGNAKVAGQPANLTVAVDYGPPRAPATVHFEMKTVVTAETLTALKLNPNAGIGGSMPLDIRITTGANTGSPAGGRGGGSLTLAADLTPASLQLPIFGWAKPAATPGSFIFAASIDGQNAGISRIDSIAAKAPGLDIETRAAGSGIELTRVHIGNTEGYGRIVPPETAEAPWRIDVAGSTLDVSAVVDPPAHPGIAEAKAAPKPAKPAPKPAAPPSSFRWRATAHFNHLQLATPPAAGLRDFEFSGSGQGNTVFDGAATAMLNSGKPVDLTITPAAGPPTAGSPASSLPGTSERLRLHTGDGGEFLRELGAYKQISGGDLDFDVRYGDALPLSGVTTMTHFRLLNAPAFAKFLQAITVIGIPAAASGPGLELDRLIAPFSIDDGVLALRGSRAYSASLGFTASGTIDLNAGVYDIHGTVVPAYALNALPGKIPLIGKLFSPEKGGGLFAMRYSVTGPTADPKIHINPLSALTPGFLRGIFALGKTAK